MPGHPHKRPSCSWGFRKAHKLSHLYAVQGKETVEVGNGIPGDIRAVTKIDEIQYNAVLHDDHATDTVRMDADALPAPIYGLAIEAKTRGDEGKISDTLAKLSAEDPTFVVEHNTTTNETVIRGVGELPRMTLERMKERYNVEVETRTPKIAFKETIQGPAEGHHRHKLPAAQDNLAKSLRVEPWTAAGFSLRECCCRRRHSSQFIPAVEKGVRQVLETAPSRLSDAGRKGDRVRRQAPLR